jgi:D-xylose transport system substrate-binding protein
MTIYKPLSRCARAAAELAVKLAQGKPIIARGALHNGKVQVPSIFVDVVPVTRDNMMESVVKDGFHPFDEIYKGLAEGQRPKGSE